jgi:ADP-ribosylglycohydrolase
MMARSSGSPAWVPAEMKISEDEMTLRAGAFESRAPVQRFPNGERNGFATLAQLAHHALDDSITVRCCASCARFSFSGLSFQFSGGTRGYCALSGRRERAAEVDIGFGCSEHVPIEGWPDDLATMDRRRMEQRVREPSPPRLPAFEATILGLAVGDALGYPVEFGSRAQIINFFGARGVEQFSEAHGLYSDDTQLSLAVAEALITVGTADVDALMREMARLFIAWSTSPENNRAPGVTTLKGCARLAAGIDWREAGLPESKGAGSAMRVAPIGLVCWRDAGRAVELARASSLLTHRHDAAIEGAAAAALLVAMAMQKRTPQEMHRAVLEECGSRSADLARALAKIPDFLDSDPAIALSRDGLGLGWVAEEAVACALYCFWRSPEDYRATVVMAVNVDGDSDTIGCIAGGISGAFNGVQAIPEAWRTRVENADALRAIADRLLVRAAGGGPA